MTLGLGQQTDPRRSEWHLRPGGQTLSIIHSECEHELGEEGRDAVTVDGGGRRGHEWKFLGRAGYCPEAAGTQRTHLFFHLRPAELLFIRAWGEGEGEVGGSEGKSVW